MDNSAWHPRKPGRGLLRQRRLWLILLAMVFSDPGGAVLAQNADRAMQKKLVGVWYIPADELQARQTNNYAVQQLNADGSGGMYVHQKNYCGPVIQFVPLRWNLKGAVLIEHYRQNGKDAMALGKIVSVDANHYVQGNAKGGVAPLGHYMTFSRAPDCAIS